MNVIYYVKVPKRMRDQYGVIHFIGGKAGFIEGMLMFDTLSWGWS